MLKFEKDLIDKNLTITSSNIFYTELENMEVVNAAAAVISRRVDLDQPDKTVWIEIIGEWTGVSVLDQRDDILSIMTMRDDMY